MAKSNKNQEEKALNQAMAAMVEPPSNHSQILRELDLVETVLRAESERLHLSQRAVEIFGKDSSKIPVEIRRDAARLSDVLNVISLIQTVKSKIKTAGSATLTPAGIE